MHQLFLFQNKNIILSYLSRLLAKLDNNRSTEICKWLEPLTNREELFWKSHQFYTDSTMTVNLFIKLCVQNSSAHNFFIFKIKRLRLPEVRANKCLLSGRTNMNALIRSSSNYLLYREKLIFMIISRNPVSPFKRLEGDFDYSS